MGHKTAVHRQNPFKTASDLLKFRSLQAKNGSHLLKWLYKCLHNSLSFSSKRQSLKYVLSGLLGKKFAYYWLILWRCQFFSKLRYKFNKISIKPQLSFFFFFCKIKQTDSKNYMKMQRTKNSQRNHGEKQEGRILLLERDHSLSHR